MRYIPLPVQNLVIRPGTPEDNDFVAKSWAETFRGNPAERRIEESFFKRAVYPRIHAVLERAQVRVACPREDGHVVYGFAVLEPACIHMVYVRRTWRKLGIAKALLAGVSLPDTDWSTQSSDFREWIRHKHQLRHYRPFWAQENGNG